MGLDDHTRCIKININLRILEKKDLKKNVKAVITMISRFWDVLR